MKSLDKFRLQSAVMNQLGNLDCHVTIDGKTAEEAGTLYFRPGCPSYSPVTSPRDFAERFFEAWKHDKQTDPYTAAMYVCRGNDAVRQMAMLNHDLERMIVIYRPDKPSFPFQWVAIRPERMHMIDEIARGIQSSVRSSELGHVLNLMTAPARFLQQKAIRYARDINYPESG